MKHTRAYDTFKAKYSLQRADMRRLGVQRMYRPRCWSLTPIMRV
jgi:hypothetical protein